MSSEELKQFLDYHEAVQADRYRVTSIQMKQDGSRMTFILDKKDGVTIGFTPTEIEQRMQEMLRLQSRGENLYYTPLSAQKHHILVDDMDRAKLSAMIADGYQPCIVLESSPGNYQALVTVPKLGTQHDRDVGNRLSDRLNKEYGDPKLSGCIHPHRAVGFQNRKPKHYREDGTYPQVRLLKSARRECQKTLDLSKKIDADYQQQAAQKTQQPSIAKPAPALEHATATTASNSGIVAYQNHYKDILVRQKGGVDLSRIDAMIAVRMRVTGHDQSSIEGVLRQCAPTIRLDDAQGRDWSDYAQRTARHAFSPAADLQAGELEKKYKQHWTALESK